MDSTSKAPRDFSLEGLLEEATLKACRDGIPDDITYWDVVGAQWKRQKDMGQNDPLPRDTGTTMGKTEAYPEGTTLELRKQGAGGAEEELVDLVETKRRAASLRKDRYVDFKKAEQALHNRHLYFIRSLRGRAKQIADGIHTDEEQFREYNRRTSWQKTNYVWALIVRETRTLQVLQDLKGHYDRLLQKPTQSNADYIRHLEGIRRKLARQGHIIPPQELALKIADTLNSKNSLHLSYYDFDPEKTSLRQLKDFLIRQDQRDRKRSKDTRDTHPDKKRGWQDGSLTRASGQKRAVRIRMSAQQYREGKRRMDRPRPSPSATNTITCYNCGEPGHKSPDCPKPRTQPNKKPRPAPKAKAVSSIYEAMHPNDAEVDAKDPGIDEGHEADAEDVIHSEDEGWDSLPSDLDDDDEIELQISCITAPPIKHERAPTPESLPGLVSSSDSESDVPALVTDSEDSESDDQDGTSPTMGCRDPLQPAWLDKDDDDDDIIRSLPGVYTRGTDGSITANLDAAIALLSEMPPQNGGHGGTTDQAEESTETTTKIEDPVTTAPSNVAPVAATNRTTKKGGSAEGREKKEALLELLGLNPPKGNQEIKFTERQKAIAEASWRNAKSLAEEGEPESGDEDELNQTAIPIKTCAACRITMFAGTDRQPLTFYVDPGAAASFITAEAANKLSLARREEEPTRFSGAITGQLRELVDMELSPTMEGKPIPTVAYVKAKLGKQYNDGILGLPAVIDLGLTMSVTPEEFVLRFNKHDKEHRVAHQGGITTVAATKAKDTAHHGSEAGEDAKRTTHPTRKNWEEKLSHVKGPVKEKLLKLLDEFKEQFWVSGYLPPIKGCRYSIQYEGPPFREPLIPLTKEDTNYVNDYFDDQIRQGLVVEVAKDTHRLPYVSNMFLKYEEDKKRPCINYRKLNARTLKTEMPIPSKERLIATFAGADWYITTDCKAAYNQLVIEEPSRPYLTIVFPGRNGRRRYVMPTRANFGSSNMPGEYQRISGDLFEDSEVGVYLDDITIKGYNGREDEAIGRFRRVLETCREHQITLSFKKTEIMKKEVNFLGEVLDKNGHRPNPKRVQALQQFPLPTTRKRLRGFLGLYNFLAPLRRHAVSPAIAELSALTSSKIPYNVSKVRAPFEKAKEDLAIWLLLTPFNPEAVAYVMTDSSDSGMGGAIFQVYNGELRAAAVCSKKWPTRKRELPAHTKEGLALITTAKRFEDMLRNGRVTFLTDSANTVDLLTNADWKIVPSLWLRWRRYLREMCQAEVLHIPGPINLAADVLSRQSYILSIEAVPEEVFFTPLLRNIHDEQQTDAYVLNKRKELKDGRGGLPHQGKVPQAYFFVEHNLLKRKHHIHGTQLVIPQAMVKKILYLEHDTVLKGHPGRDVMRLATKQKYFWPTMNDDIAKYVESCLGCQLAKAKMTKRFASHASRQITELFAVFSMDLCDMSHVSQRFKYILVVMDDFSSFVILTNLRDKRATTVLAALWDVFTLFGPPQALLSDRGAEFLNQLVERFTEQSGIQHIITYAYHAQGNGRNERSHQVINNTLRILAQDHPSKWHKYTKGIQYMMNTRPNVDTGISPYEIMFGRRPRTLWNVSPYLEYDHSQMIKLRDAIEGMIRLHRQQRIKHTAKPRPKLLDVGKLVKVVKPFPRRPKYRHPAMGPYRVEKHLSNSGYLLKHTVTEKTLEAPAYWVHPIKNREGDGESAEQTNEQATKPDGEAPTSAPQPTKGKAGNHTAKATEPIQPSSESEAEVEQHDSIEATNGPTKRRRLLQQLEAHNQIPKVADETSTKAGIGNMIAVKVDDRARLAEIRGELDEDWEVHWFGTTSSRSRPRRHWKFYPGWTDAKTGETRYSSSTMGTGRPAMGQVRKEDIIVAFQRLTIQATIPTGILKKLEKYTLG